jgi:rhodanese-related sulfurtransferase
MFFNVQEVDAPQVAKWLENNNNNEKIRVIDVREMHEIAAGTIAGAEPMPLATLPLRTQEIGPEEKVVFLCRSGARSAQACAFLAQRGYENIYNLRGGIMAWAQHGFPAVLPKSA